MAPPRGEQSVADGAVDELAQDVCVSRVPAGLQDQVQVHPPQRQLRALRRVVEAVLGGDRSGAVALRLVGTDDIVQLLVRLQPQVGLRVFLGPWRCRQLRGGNLPDLLGERAQFHPPKVFDQAAEVGAGRNRAAPSNRGPDFILAADPLALPST